MKVKPISILVVMVMVLLGGAAMADGNVPTSTDEARAAAGQAQYAVSFIPTAPPVEPVAHATTTDEARALVARAQHRIAPSRVVLAREEPEPVRTLAVVTSSDEARAVARHAWVWTPALRTAPEPDPVVEPESCPMENPCGCAVTC